MVDYTIVSDDFINYVSHFQVGDISSFSDHCPLYLHLSTEPGSFFRISRMNMLSKNLLQDVLERMDTHQDGVCSQMELESGSPEQVLHTPEDKLAEIFSNQDFCNKIASLQTELSVSPATECAHKFTCLLQDALQAKTKKRKNKNTFPRNTWFDEECKQKKKCFKKAAKRVKENPNNSALRELMWKERRIYKSLIKKKKCLAISKLHTGIQNLKSIGILEKNFISTEIPITSVELRAYFKSILDAPEKNGNSNSTL